jgi:hypothetical protein
MFPDLSKKADLRCSVLLEDQIFLIDVGAADAPLVKH